MPKSIYKSGRSDDLEAEKRVASDSRRRAPEDIEIAELAGDSSRFKHGFDDV